MPLGTISSFILIHWTFYGGPVLHDFSGRHKWALQRLLSTTSLYSYWHMVQWDRTMGGCSGELVQVILKTRAVTIGAAGSSCRTAEFCPALAGWA